jgi:hypothetical protein
MRQKRSRLFHASRVIALWMLASLCFLCISLQGYAEEAITITSSSYQVNFASDITFRLQVEAEKDLQQLTLFYRQEGEGLTIRVPIPVSSGQRAFAHKWELEPGEVPVGEGIDFDWHIVDEVGNEVRTAPSTFLYEDDRFDWQVFYEGDIVLHWYGSDQSEARRLLGYADQALMRLQQEMGVILREPVHVYAYRSKSDMSLTLPRRSEAFDDRILTLGVVVDDATLLLLGTHSDVEGTIAHELSHIVVGLVTDNPYTDIPRWLDEGLAMYAEGDLPSGNRRALDAAVRRDQLISVRSLSAYTGDPAEVDLFYGEAYSVVDYLLRSYGQGKMAQLLGAFTEGITQEEALQRAYGLGIEDLDAAWRESLGLQARDKATSAAPSTEPPVERPNVVPCAGILTVGVLGIGAQMMGSRRARAS